MFNTKTDEELLIENLIDLLTLVGKKDIELLESIVDELEGDERYFHEGVYENIKDAKNKTVANTKQVKRTITHKINKTGDHIDNLIKIARKHIVGASRDEIMTNHVKVSTIIKRILSTGALYLIHPAVGLLYLFVTTALKKKLTVREQEKILADLKLELEICEEKINDATNAGDKKGKYELMRLRNELKKNILRIQNAGRGIRNIG